MCKTLHLPAQRVTVYKELHRGGRGHVVAVHIGYVGESDVEIALVDASVQFVDVYQQLVVATHETEFQVMQLLTELDGRAYLLVDVGHDISHRLYEQTVVLVGGVAVHVELDDLV